ncbi:hypothetical protein EVJ50_05995 [Synechococcus sp. RSCCF101]|uniref:hypothetical protein n=1 Tax=Synechococcus sp. RSCCF101 TaxID=2511069 RepID=UPI001246C6A7|nr:hypothetical protein [Synechococcus sp. RSCCF101]QEY31860.1 hypothetical protein EVJ50_05995 [Synechococcus sp. RSCCF101]
MPTWEGDVTGPRMRLVKRGSSRGPAPRRRRLKPLWRRLTEPALLVAAGVGLLLALVRVPRDLDVLLVISEVIDELIAGLALLARSVLSLAGMLLMVGLAVMALLLIVAGLVRFGRVLLSPFQSRRP